MAIPNHNTKNFIVKQKAWGFLATKYNCTCGQNNSFNISKKMNHITVRWMHFNATYTSICHLLFTLDCWNWEQSSTTENISKNLEATRSCSTFSALTFKLEVYKKSRRIAKHEQSTPSKLMSGLRSCYSKCNLFVFFFACTLLIYFM